MLHGRRVEQQPKARAEHCGTSRAARGFAIDCASVGHSEQETTSMPATALDPSSALVVIDLQRGLAAYPTVHPFRDVLANTLRLAEEFRRAGLPVVLVTVNFSP